MEQEFLTGAALQRTICSFTAQVNDHGNMVKSATSPQQVACLSKMFMSQERIKHMGDQSVTIVNLNPYQLRVNSPLFDNLDVPANKPGDSYSALVIRSVKYQIDAGVDNNWSPEEFWPAQLASEFITQYQEKGGVFLVRGDLEKNPQLAHTAAFKASHAAADTQLIAYCRKLKRNADDQWNTPNRVGSRNIHPPHRVAAQLLLSRKLIKEAPAWLNGDVAPEDITEDCPGCSSATKKGQVMCPCSYVLDPIKAFQRDLINEFHISLERLSRKQVEDLGISAYVAETSDEKPARLKAGRPKPLSAFDRRQQELADRQAAAAQRPPVEQRPVEQPKQEEASEQPATPKRAAAKSAANKGEGAE